MAPIDPHSFTDSTHPVTTHISLSLYLDFPSSTIHAIVLSSLSNPHTGPLSLDTRSLTIHSVLDPQSQAPIANLLSLLHRRSPLPSIFFLSSSTSPPCPAIDRRPQNALTGVLCVEFGSDYDFDPPLSLCYFIFSAVGVMGFCLCC